MPRIPINMPKMSMTMEVGTMVEWTVEVGDTIKNGDVVAVVTTDKVDMEVEATADGTMAEIVAAVDEVIPVGQPIAWVDSESDDLLGDLFASAPAEPAEAETPKSEETAAEVTAEGAQPASEIITAEGEAQQQGGQPAGQGPAETADPSGSEPVRAVPLARKLAKEAGIDLNSIKASGVNRTVRARDVRDAIAAKGTAPETAAPGTDAAPAGTAPAAAPKPAKPSAKPSAAPVAAPSVQAADDELLGDGKERRIRVATSKAMSPSAFVPQFTVYRALDLTQLARARKASLKGISWTAILLRAYALVLREYPNLNGYWAGKGVKRNEQVGVVLAVDTPNGLLAPVITDPDRMTLKTLDQTMRQIAADAKEGRVDPSLFSGATGTLSNLGGMGVDRFNALITPPQATALSTGTVGLRPAFDEDGQVFGRMSCEVGLTIDHRAADGADAARALQTMQDLLFDPVLLLA